MSARNWDGRLILAILLAGCGGGGGSGNDGEMSSLPASSATGSNTVVSESSESARTASEAVADTMSALLSRTSRTSFDAAGRSVTVSCPEGGQAATDAQIAADLSVDPRTYTFTATTTLLDCNGYSGELTSTGGGQFSKTLRTISFQTTGAATKECLVEIASLQIDATRAGQGAPLEGTVDGILDVTCNGVTSTCTLDNVALGQVRESIDCAPKPS